MSAEEMLLDLLSMSQKADLVSVVEQYPVLADDLRRQSALAVAMLTSQEVLDEMLLKLYAEDVAVRGVAAGPLL